eukprot:TRINITY_DN47_c0_g1_i1.p1 TRINITY_DN47_c0_g1~~TRINITY_DN47_c0_g1_i1.p1  ORF type:complete len:343 (-),score=41.46 TRINITY_DN47_c0_g1_i1:82-1110(-)
MKFFIFLLSFGIIFCQVMQLHKTHSKYHTITNSAGKIPLSNNDFFHYYGNFQFGTPAQNTTFITDTSSTQLWIPTNQNCYNSSQSTSANITTTPGVIQYGKSLVAGYMGTDILSVPTIGLMNLTMTTLFANTEKDMGGQTACGLMGLSNDMSWNNFIDVAFKKGLLADSKFGFRLNDTDLHSYFYIGSSSFPGLTLTWLKVIRATYWSIAIDSTLINNQTFAQPTGMKEGILDTGTSLILIATTAMNGLLSNTNLQSQCQNQSNSYICPCSGSYPTVGFKSGTNSMSVSYSNYMIPLGGGFCLLGFEGIDPSQLPFIILGDSFLRGYFLALDKTNNQLGLNL